MPIVPEGPGTLYACYDTDGEIIYIGATSDIEARLDKHRRDDRDPKGSPWWDEVARVETFDFDTLAEAREREAAAIQSVRPAYNEQWKHRTDGGHWLGRGKNVRSKRRHARR